MSVKRLPVEWELEKFYTKYQKDIISLLHILNEPINVQHINEICLIHTNKMGLFV